MSAPFDSPTTRRSVLLSGLGAIAAAVGAWSGPRRDGRPVTADDAVFTIRKIVDPEVPSPVFHYARSVRNDKDELVSGRLWAELEVTDDANDRKGKPLALRALFHEVETFFKKSWRRSDPKGFWVGPHAAAAWKRGEIALREPGHRGRLVGVWR